MYDVITQFKRGRVDFNTKEYEQVCDQCLISQHLRFNKPSRLNEGTTFLTLVRISAGTPTVPAEGFPGFSQCLQTRVISTQIKLQSLSVMSFEMCLSSYDSKLYILKY